MTRQIKAGSTDVSVVIRIVDSGDGTPETGVVYNTSGLDLEYRREGAASVDITEATLAALTTAHADGGFLHIGNGYYRLDLPDTAVAAGATGVLIHGTCTGMVVIGEYIELVAYDPYDGVRMGLTALPNAAAEAAGGLFTRGTGAGQINQPANGRIDANTIAVSGTTQTARDLGASVLLSPGTGTGQVSLSSGAVTVGTNNDKTGYGLSAAAVQAIWDALTSALTAVGSIGKLLVDNINATISSRLASASYTAPLDAAGTRSAVGLASANLDTQLNNQLALLGYIDANATTILGDVANLSGRIPTALVGGRMDSNMGAVSGDATAADLLEMWLDGMVTGTAQGGDVNYITLAAGESAVDDVYKGYRVRIMSGTGVGQTAVGYAYSGTNKRLFVTLTWSITPDNTSVYLLVPFGVVMADVVSVNADTLPASNLADDYNGAGYNKANSTIGTVTNASVVNMQPSALEDLIVDDSGVTYGSANPGSVVFEIVDKLKKYLQLLARSDAAIATDNATELTELNADGGSGAGDYSQATDALEALRDRGDAAWTTGAGGTNPAVLQNTTIATLASQTSFTLTAGSADNDAYNGHLIVVTDQTTAEQKVVGVVLDYVGSTKTVTLVADPAIFTMAVGDEVDILVGKANMVAIDGALTNGNNATLNLKQLNIVNSAGTALVASSTGSSGHGISATGNGVGEGISAIGGSADGHGISATGQGVGWGIVAASPGNAGFYAAGGGANSPGIDVTGAGAGAGIRSTGGPTGHGISAVGGSSSGNGLNAAATAGNGHGVNIAGQGSGHGINVTGGATGNGIDANGGATSGDGINAAATTSGDGMELVGAGGGLDLNATTTDSLEVNATAGGGLTAQATRDAMKLAPTAGAAAGGSIDDMIATNETNINDIQDRIPVALVGGRMDSNMQAAANGVITAAVIASGAIDADALAADAVDEILDEVVEGSLTLRQALRVLLAALANKASGGGTTTVTFRDLADSKARITATVDANGNRTAVTLDGS